MISAGDIFFEVHAGLPREAPGDEASTARALGMMQGLPAVPSILDIACGPGAQTIALAKHSAARITAIDVHQPFLDELQRRTEQAGVAGRVTPLKMSMFELKFDKSFDVLWSEGAIYMMGFEDGLRAWRPLLKPGGHIAVTELSWTKPDPPREVLDYWRRDYPGIGSVEQNLVRLQAAGYREIGHFAVPESAWWEPYYHPMARRVDELRQKYAGDAQAQGVLDGVLTEIDMYRRYCEWYGYVFYVMQAQ